MPAHLLTRDTQSSRLKALCLRLSWLVLALIVVLQSACSSLRQSPAPLATGKAPKDWPFTARQIAELRNWKLIGKIGIRTPQDSLTAAINQWQQADSSFVIDLSSTFFGLGASKLYGSANFLTIAEAGEAPVSSYEPDLLIQEALGFPLPLSSLPWWIKGIPVPETTYKLEFDAQGRPASLVQNQWQLSFSKHTLINGLPLPWKIKLQRDNVRITLAIKQWTLL